MTLRILDKKALRAKGVPYSNVHLLRLEAQEKFPKRFNLTENRVAWLEEDVDRWIRERVTASSRRTDTRARACDDPADLARPRRPRRPSGNFPADALAGGDDAA